MKKLTLCLFLFISNFLNAQEADIKQSITTFFEGMHSADTLKIKSVASNKLLLQSISEGKYGPKLFTEQTSEFYKSICWHSTDYEDRGEVIGV